MQDANYRLQIAERKVLGTTRLRTIRLTDYLTFKLFDYPTSQLPLE
jgi:hypothetical protein